MNTATQRSPIPSFNGTDLVWLADDPLSRYHQSCRCCGLSLELVAEFAAFQTCAATTARLERMLEAA